MSSTACLKDEQHALVQANYTACTCYIKEVNLLSHHGLTPKQKASRNGTFELHREGEATVGFRNINNINYNRNNINYLTIDMPATV